MPTPQPTRARAKKPAPPPRLDAARPLDPAITTYTQMRDRFDELATSTSSAPRKLFWREAQDGMNKVLIHTTAAYRLAALQELVLAYCSEVAESHRIDLAYLMADNMDQHHALMLYSNMASQASYWLGELYARIARPS